MAYVKPIVQVFQEYESMSATSQWATLNTCVVAPCYYKVDISSDKESDLYPALAGTLTESGSLPLVEIPNMKSGALVQEETVSILIRNAFVNMGDTPVSVDSVSQATVTFLSTDYPTGIKEGDYLTLKDTDNGDEIIVDKFKVISKDDTAYTVTLNRLINTTAVNMTADWLRSIDDITLPYDDSAVTVDAVTETVEITSLGVDVDGASRTVYYGVVYVGHISLRQDVSSLGSAANIAELRAKIGDTESYNPLAFGASLVLANSQNSVYFIGVNSDDVAGFTAAKDRLEGLTDIYCIVPLSQESSILNIFATHATQFSMPEVSEWRICLGNTPLPEQVTVTEGLGTVTEDLSSDPRVIECTEADFITNDVQAGDPVWVYSDPETYTELVVDSVISEDALIVSSDMTSFSVGSTYDFKVVRSSDRSLQAGAVADTSSSFNNRRFYHVWPDICYVNGEKLPGYYLCCAVGGMVSGLPPHQGLTRLSVAGIDALEHSSDYFNAEQLDTIADGGTFIFTQLNPSAPPFVRHQLSTDTSVFEFQEMSFVKNYDFVSYILRDVLDKFLGQYNITPTTLASLETAARAVLESLKLYSLPKIGSPILAYNQDVSTYPSESTGGRVEMYAYVEFPTPLNMIGMHIVSTTL